MTLRQTARTALLGTAVTFALAGSAFAEGCDKITFSDVGWTDIQVTTGATSVVLEALPVRQRVAWLLHVVEGETLACGTGAVAGAILVAAPAAHAAAARRIFCAEPCRRKLGTTSKACKTACEPWQATKATPEARSLARPRMTALAPATRSITASRAGPIPPSAQSARAICIGGQCGNVVIRAGPSPAKRSTGAE